jgi:hypothetical protein
MNFRRLRSLNGGQETLIKCLVADNQTIVYGDLLVISAGKVAKAAPAATAIIGIAKGDITTTTATADDLLMVSIVDVFSVFEVKTTGGDLADAGMYTTRYDIDASQVLKVDDTTDGFLIPIAFDNTANTAKVIFDGSKLWLTEVQFGDIPVKATGAEVTTGTNDTKFATPKAMKDSDYWNTTDNQMAVQAASTAGDVAAMVVDFNALLTKLKAKGLMANA